MNTSDILNKAADLIEQRGWRRSEWGLDSDTAPLCVEGAICAAMGLTNHGEIDRQSCPAYVAVKTHLGARCRNDVVPDAADAEVWAWNDTVAESAAEVIEVLRATALIEAARETEAAAVSA